MVKTTGSPTGPGARWGTVGDDPVGTASARLLAAGVSRRDRLDALSLLGLLGDHAGHDGLVRLPLSTLAGEFSMPEARARRLLGALVEVGAVVLHPDGLMVVSWQPSASEGLRLAGFLANVAIVFDEDDTDDVLVVDDLPPARRPVFAAGGASRRRREPVLVAVVTLAAALLATLAPSSGPPTALRTMTSSPLATSLADGDPTTRGPDPGEESEASPSQYRSDPSVPPSPIPSGPSGDGQTTSESPAVAPAFALPDGPTAVPVSPGPVSGENRTASPVPAPPDAEPTGRVRVPPVGTPSPSPAPVAPDPMVCPIVEVPYAVIDSVVVGAPPVEGLAGLAGPAFVEVTGTVVNPGSVGVVVGHLEIGVDLGRGRVVLPESPSPLTVPAEAQGAWRMTSTLPAGSEDAERDDVDARVLRWWWLDEAVSEACPT